MNAGVLNEALNKCVALSDDGIQCGQVGSSRTGIPFPMPLCERHGAMRYTYDTKRYRNKLMQRIEEAGSFTHVPGFTYVAELPDGLLKIGSSGNRVGNHGKPTLSNRWKAISGEFKLSHPENYMIRPIAVLDGGISQEALLHEKWADLRIDDKYGERFKPDPELISWAKDQGYTPNAADAINDYRGWHTLQTGKIEKKKREDQLWLPGLAGPS
ncbi:hypothetical protein [Streptomyces sp. CBMA29]|uniref:hypothetical protein n=1 Tax=Streptomyces sp. CBMA29 TaxID=1896314 RepID=UPI001661C281|nr:hypothetical protein [Streptomyces sp. CBMA29]